MTVIYVCKMIISSGIFPIFWKILIFWVHRLVKGQKTVQNDKKLCLLHSISQEPYIWLSFVVQMCKMLISPEFFFFFFFFNVKILVFQVVKGLKGQKWLKMSKISVCCTLYFRKHTSYDLHLWYTCMYKSIISPGIFFSFFKILIFKIIRGEVKGQKMAQSDNIFCQSHSKSQEPYIILQFLVHMCKMMIPPANFFIFQNFDFWGF